MKCPTSDQKQCPDLTKAKGKTLHWAWPYLTHDPPGNITVQFSGTAVYVYNVLRDVQDKSFLANITFILDGIWVGSYKQPEGLGSLQYSYNQLVYANKGLSIGDHELVVVGDKSLLMFDYIEYTLESTDVSLSTVSPLSPLPSLPTTVVTSLEPVPLSSPLNLPTTLTATTSILQTTTITAPVSNAPQFRPFSGLVNPTLP